jgi:hypothetical protein
VVVLSAEGMLTNSRKPKVYSLDAKTMAARTDDGEPHPPARRKAILLDVDGVLHPFETGEHFVAGCMKQLRAIVAATGASIYLSSSWQSTEVCFVLYLSLMRTGTAL